MQVLDANEGRVARQILLPHDKNIHRIVTPIPTPHIPLSSHSFNLFTTMSAESLVLLWDLRAFNPIQRFSTHVNRRESTLNNAFSPCMKYLAIPSEDRTVRIMDLRMATSALSSSAPVGPATGSSGSSKGELFKVVTGQKDVISCVAYNPLFAQLAIGSYDGTVRFFCDPNHAQYNNTLT